MAAAVRRFFILMGVLAMAAVTLSGCLGVSRQQALSMLKERYNDEFKITSFRIGGSYNTATVVSKSHPDLPFKAYFNSDGSNFSDTYAPRVLAKRISDEFQNECGGTGEMYFYASFYPYTKVTSKIDYTLEEWLEEQSSRFLDVSLFLSEVDDADALYDGLQKVFKKLDGFEGNFHLYNIDEELQKEVEVWFTEHTSTAECFSYLMKGNHRRTLDYSEGKLDIEKDRFVTYWAW